jgi:hypothetical protein
LLDRSDGNIDSAGLVMTTLNANRAALEAINATPLAPAPKDAPTTGLARTKGLLNPDGIVAVAPGTTPTTILYVQKQKNGALALPPNQQCATQPYAPYGASAPKSANPDLITIRLATTTDGINFTDQGPVNGLNDPTTTSLLGTRYVAPSGTMIRLDGGRYGLFFAGGNCMDADSDAFHYIGYAESSDLLHWTIVNGIDHPIAALSPQVVTVNGTFTTVPAQPPVVGDAQPWYRSRVYAPSITKLDATHVTMTFAGYEVQSPNNDLLNYRTIGHVVLNASRALP